MSNLQFKDRAELLAYWDKINIKPDMTHESLMYFGKHNGKKLGDIPAKYFLWLWDNADFHAKLFSPRDGPLANYIKDNMKQFLKEEDDYIPQHPVK